MTNGADPARSYLSEDDCRLADLIDLVRADGRRPLPVRQRGSSRTSIYAELDAWSARRQTRRAEAIS